MPLIPTSTSLIGRLAGDPRLQRSADGVVHVRVRADVFPPRRRHADGTREKQPPVTVDLAGFDEAAEALHHRFRFGDWFLASGRLKTNRNGSPSFIARRIGHDAANADYTVRRTRKRGARRRSDGDGAGRVPIAAGRILPDGAHAAETA
ncbi:single-stranded DNA-binding protein [Myceligenerans xiligouense]|uniref:Single-stranded DNA-binding protein n=1 Tax=Myceligenerans xiligouense TaxID=253184 RepID=A0A3N4YPY6_9MICO|nr:hypothetical protein [Myceligenerans xiligouense]RPF21434.1 hypothetical protein EDD34_2061 [Myceligenerans xiligouense]